MKNHKMSMLYHIYWYCDCPWHHSQYPFRIDLYPLRSG